MIMRTTEGAGSMMKKKFLKVSKDEFNGYFGGYSFEGDIAYAHEVLSAMMFDYESECQNEWLDKAKLYLEINGFQCEEMTIEYNVYKS